MENILKKRRIKFEKKMKLKIFNILHKIATNYKFWSQQFPLFLIMKM